jgi:hypothetical protein
MKFTTAGIADYVEEQNLNTGLYKFQCYDSKIYEGGSKEDIHKKLQLNLVVLDGEQQRDGSSPVERKFTDFIALDHYEAMKDGGTFQKNRLKNALNVFDVSHDDDEWDSEDFRDKVVLGKLKEGMDQNGEPRTQMDKYSPAPGEDY